MDQAGLLGGQPNSTIPVAQPAAMMPTALPVAQPASSAGSSSLPVAQPVQSLMPTAPPIASLRDTWSDQANMQAEDAGEVPKAEGNYAMASAPAADADFYSAQELGVLQAQAAPIDTFTSLKHEGQMPAVVDAVPVAQATPVLTTAVGVPIYPVQVRSTAKTEQDGSHGVKSCDESLNTVPDILNFLNTYNTRPRLCCRVHGYHRERRHRTVTETDSEGNKRTRREEYWVGVSLPPSPPLSLSPSLSLSLCLCVCVLPPSLSVSLVLRL
jgi:hypothetical protein